MPRTISGTVRKTGRKIDGADVYVASLTLAGAITAGSTSRSGTIANTLSAATRIWGGATRANGTLLPVKSRGSLTMTSAGFDWTCVVEINAGTYKIRSTVGASYTGGTNALSNGTVVAEILL